MSLSHRAGVMNRTIRESVSYTAYFRVTKMGTVEARSGHASYAYAFGRLQ